MPHFVVKAFDKDYNKIPFAIYDDDFTMEIPDDCVLKKISRSQHNTLNQKSIISITLEALSPSEQHKCTVIPSVAVNPPAIQYFKGLEKVFFTDTIKDNRKEQISSFVITMLSSKDYPNPQICSKTKAKEIAKCIPRLIENLRHTKKTTVTFP
jgi:hypothetical protein